MEVIEIIIRHQTFILHPSGAIFWKEKSYLLIADIHFGKITHFRKHGSGIPQQAIEKNIKTLNKVYAFFRPETIVFMGDVFHSYLNTEWLLFKEWIENSTSETLLITGNHDIIPIEYFEEIGIACYSELCVGTILMTHHPEIREGYFNIAGHIHPGIHLVGMGKQSEKVACFYMQPNQIIQPAFGTFTGKYLIKPQKQDRIFAIADQQVIEIPITL